MFYHGYHSCPFQQIYRYHNYLLFGFPSSEVRPITCQRGSFDLSPIPYLTLIDTLDTFLVLGDYEGFRRNVELLEYVFFPFFFIHRGLQSFDIDTNVSFFETTIRVLGGLLSAHMMIVSGQFPLYTKQYNATLHEYEYIAPRDANYPYKSIYAYVYNHFNESTAQDLYNQVYKKEMKKERYSKPLYNNVYNTNFSFPMDNSSYVYHHHLLDLAVDLGQRLLPAFSSKTGIAYGTVNLRTGIPRGVCSASIPHPVGDGDFFIGWSRQFPHRIWCSFGFNERFKLFASRSKESHSTVQC